MLTTSSCVSLERSGAVLSQKLAQLFGALVLVLDAEQAVIASSDPQLNGNALSLVEKGDLQAAFRVPFYVNEQPGEVIVMEPSEESLISRHLAEVMIELLINEVMSGEPVPTQQQVKNKFIYDLLSGSLDDETAVLQQAELLGLDLMPPRAVLLIDASDYILLTAGADQVRVQRQVQQRAQRIINQVVEFFHLPSDLICAYIGGGHVAVLKASDTSNLAAWANGEAESENRMPSWANLTALKRAADSLLPRLPSGNGGSVNIGIGRYHPGVLGLARSYQDARMALALGERLHSTKSVHCLDDMGIASFVGIGDEQTKIELAVHLLSPLDDEPELLRTLDVFFAEDCSASMAASQLYIHRNTLGYRLDKVTSLTGLDPRCFDEAVQIRLALLMRSLIGKEAVSSASESPILPAMDVLQRAISLSG